MPTAAPDLTKTKLGPRIDLFNGKDLSGWRPHEPDAGHSRPRRNHWSDCSNGHAGKIGGQWQTCDFTLVKRHVSAVLNGQTVIDNQPIYLQGDHTAVSYRNIYLEPVVKN